LLPHFRRSTIVRGLNRSDYCGVQCHAVSTGRFGHQGEFMSFGIYAAGFAILIGGLVYAAHLVHLPTQWIVVGAIVMIGIGLLSAVKVTRQKDSAS
jgi:hypothetical protein